MTEEELKHCEQLATGLRMVEGVGEADAVDALVAEVRRLQEMIPWCPRGKGEHLLDDTFSGWCSTCRDTVT